MIDLDHNKFSSEQEKYLVNSHLIESPRERMNIIERWLKGLVGDRIEIYKMHEESSVNYTISGKFSKYERENPKNGLMVTNYEIMIEIGRFHPIKETKPDSGVYVTVEEPVMINPGEIYNVGGKKIIDNAMRNCKLGQKVLMRFIDTFKMPKGTAKTIEVKLGVMDTSYNAPENNGDTHLE